ncbi:MAG: HEPN domain-containing protein [Cytophagaceae bacterium]
MKVFIPLRGPEINDIHAEYERFLGDFRKLKDTYLLKKQIDNYETKYQRIEELKFNVIYSSKFAKKQNKQIQKISNIHESFKVDYIEDFLVIYIIFKNKNSDNEEYSSIIINQILQRLILLLNLTYATKIDFLPGVIYSNDGRFLSETEIILSNLDFAYEIQLKTKWPKIYKLKLTQTLEWYSSNGLHIDFNSRNKLHRAINSFSYQFSNIIEHDTSILFWTMLGIEALLAEGNVNIINQIKAKTALILGEPEEFKKRLDKLYNYRSRFVHGDIDFPAKFSSDYENFESEYYEYLNFATSILLSLIRTLIIQNKSEFKFIYKLN